MKNKQPPKFSENEFVYIENNGSEIISTNYFKTKNSKNGHLYLSFNNGAFRLLVPAFRDAMFDEFEAICENNAGPTSRWAGTRGTYLAPPFHPTQNAV